MTGTLLNVAKPFDGAWKTKAEEWLVRQYPTQISSGWYSGIHMGRNDDAAVTQVGGFKTTGQNFRRSAMYLEVPDKIITSPELIANPEALIKTFTTTQISDSVSRLAAGQVQRLVKSGMKVDDAKAQVAQVVNKIGYFDTKTNQYVLCEPVLKSTHDSILTGMTVPYWNVSRIPKVYRTPVLRGYADNLVAKVGVPNLWADIIQLFVASYEGKARVSSVAHADGFWDCRIYTFH
jgi:hypothetical protein